MGAASATEVSEDVSDTNSITDEAVIQDTHKVSDTAMQENKVDNNIQTGKASDNELNENTTKTINKNTKSDVKTATTISNWEELKKAVQNVGKKENVTLTLGEGTYINTGSITWSNKDIVLTIDGNGQTINGNKNQVFYVNTDTTLILKNIIIINASSPYGGAIGNQGNLTIINSTLAYNTASKSGGAIRNVYGYLNIINSTLANNTAPSGGAIDTYAYSTIITHSILANNTAKWGGVIENNARLSITASIVANNTATKQGGVLYQATGRTYNFTNSTFINNHANSGAVIYTPGEGNLKGNIFTNNTAGNSETIYYWSEYFSGSFKANVYESTDISLKTKKLTIKNNRTFFSTDEEIVLNYSIALQHPNFYDKDILERLDDITLYVNDVEYATTKYEDYALTNLKPGNYSVYYKSCNKKSNTVNFWVYSITNWQELSDAVRVAEGRTDNITLKLMEGNYTNTCTINWTNPNMVLTIDGNGQTIDGNQLQVFNIKDYGSLVIKNITIQNAKSKYGAIYNRGSLTVIDSTFVNNTSTDDGGAISNYGLLNMTNCALENNTATVYGGAIRNGYAKFNISGSNFTGNHAGVGGAIASYGNSNLKGNTFTNNTADNRETIDLYGYHNGHADSNLYESTDISLKSINLSLKDNQTTFNLGEDVELNFTIALTSPHYYDSDILEKLDDITIFVNGREYATIKYENYTLTNLKPGNYSVYYKTCNQESNTVTFKVTSPITNWQELSDAVRYEEDQTEDTIIYLWEGTYTNTGTITWSNPDIVLTIDGIGQTIDGNQLQTFIIDSGASMILENITITNAKSDNGGAIENHGTLTVTESKLANNIATEYGGAIINYGTLNITESTLANNTAYDGGAIYSIGQVNIADNIFANNTADNRETIDLEEYENARIDSNVYESTDITLNTVNLMIKDNQKIFNSGEGVVLNFTIDLENPNNYDSDLLERLDDITIYVNGEEYAKTRYENYTLSKLKPGEYTVYYKTCNHESNTVTFQIKPITNWQELREAVRYAEYQSEDTTLYMGQGTYTNTDTIIWSNPDIVLTIEGNGQTIDGNQQQTFIIDEGASMILENITITNAKSGNGGAIDNEGTLTIAQSTLANNIATLQGGAIYNEGTLTITDSTLANNTAFVGGAIRNLGTLTMTHSTLANNTAMYVGGAIRSTGHATLTDNIFTENSADNRETNDFSGNGDGSFDSNVYESTDIALKTLKLSPRYNQIIYNLGERVVLRSTIELEHPNYYDTDILERLDDITLYINGVKNQTGKYNNYSLSNLRPGEYTVYLTTCNQESNRVTFKVVYANLTTQTTPTHLIISVKDYDGKAITDGFITTNITESKLYPDDNGQVFIPLRNMKGGKKFVNVNYTGDSSYANASTNVTFSIFVPNNKINVTTWDVEMVQGRGVTLSAIIYNENKTVNYGKAYFIIDDKPLVNENGLVRYVSVKNSRADLPYDIPSDVSLGNHTLSAVFIEYSTSWNSDDKTLTIIENIPEGAGDEDKVPSVRPEKQESYMKNTARQRRHAKTIHSTVAASHKVIVDNNVMAVSNTVTLGKLCEIFNQSFINGHLLLYIDGELVFNDTVGDDLTAVIFEIIEKYLGKHEIKVEFTDADGKKNTYNKTITIE